MTEEQKQQIISLREQGLGYMKVAQQTGISLNTVKSFCRRNIVVLSKPKAFATKGICEQCGKPVTQIEGRKLKRFCSDKCRNKWWRSNPDKVNRIAMYKYQCPNCGKEFEVYGNKNRKYCCHECYLEHRFGGEHND